MFFVLLTISIIILIYSFAINFFFGHKQFWNWSCFMMFELPCFKSLVSVSRIKKLRENFIERSLFTLLPDEIFLRVFSHFTAYELIHLASISKQFRTLSQNCSLWTDLRLQLEESVQSCCLKKSLNLFPRQKIASSCQIEWFFITVREAMKFLTCELSHKHIFVIIWGSIYDVSMFLDDHPGGPLILLEWNGKDATRLFELANHSSFANKLKGNMLIWSPVAVSGNIGLPKRFTAIHQHNR